MIAKGYKLRGDIAKSNEFIKKSEARINAVQKFCWNSEVNFYIDYDFVEEKSTGIKSLAGVYPLFLNMSDKDQAEKCANVLQREFLKDGGLLTTLADTDQQWDAPNGWAPLQWMTYKGLKNYQIDKFANEIRNRWLRQNERVYHATGKMMEKYNVMDTTLNAGGGEYPNQDGFGWTNGVALAFKKEITIKTNQ